MVLQRYQTPADSPRPDAAPARVATPLAPGESSLAVLPFDDFSANPDDQYFADGMTEVLIADPSQIEGLRVVSRTSAERYRDSDKPLPQIAAELHVGLVVEGSVTKAGDRVRVTAQLINAQSDEHIWARSYDRTMKDVLQLQGALALEIAKSVRAAVTPAQETRLARRAAADPRVYGLYLRGRHAWALRTPESLAAAIRFFTQAVTIDSEFALAHVGLADAYSLQGSPTVGAADAQAYMSRARAAATRALALDDQLSEAHTALGGVQFFGDRDKTGAERSFRRAIALNANYPVAHEWLAVLLAERGADAEATRHSDIAVNLDPMEATMHQARGVVHYYGGRFADAEAAERRALELRSQLPLARVILIRSQLMGGNAAGAAAACDADRALSGLQADLVLSCAAAYHRGGDAGRARQALDRLRSLRPVPEPAIAQWHAVTGDAAQAVTQLQALKSQGNLPANLAFDPLFAALRADSRYAALMADSRR